MSIKTYLKRGISYVLHGQPVFNNNVTAQVVQLAPNELLKGRKALITGGTSGIGRAIAEAFLRAGAEDVIITGRDSERLKKACREIEESTSLFGRIHGVEMNMCNVKEMESKWNEVLLLSRSKTIDILVNNAGVLGSAFGNTTEEDYEKVMSTNLKGVYFLSQIVAHYMKNNNIQGNILNVASSSSIRPAASVYTLSKWGIRGLTLGLAKTLAPYGITVNGIAPGQTLTSMVPSHDSIDNLYLKYVPLGRYILPKEIGSMAVILVSDIARCIMGDTVFMTGGAGVLTYEDITYKFE